jgi:excisionase family DNA binding protein
MKVTTLKRPPLRTTGQAAEYLSTGIDRVLDAIHNGDLIAVDIRTRGAKRATWRISQEALDAYLAARSTQAPATKSAREPKRSSYQPTYYK